jgi:metal-responsive CopG/Arc/MetJ family transcriptional regulator
MTIALPRKMLEQAQKVARREGIAVDELITAAVEHYLEEH